MTNHTLSRSTYPKMHLEARTGTHCPSTGLWRVSANEATLRFLPQGTMMPSLLGEPVTWTKVPMGPRA